jgi:hypothetical protein
MSNETPNPAAPGKPASRQPPDANTGQEQDTEEGQGIPKTGRDPSEPIEQDVSNDIPTDDDMDDDVPTDDDGDEDDDETGTIELPGEDGQGDRLDVSRPGNP